MRRIFALTAIFLFLPSAGFVSTIRADGDDQVKMFRTNTGVKRVGLGDTVSRYFKVNSLSQSGSNFFFDVKEYNPSITPNGAFRVIYLAFDLKKGGRPSPVKEESCEIMESSSDNSLRVRFDSYDGEYDGIFIEWAEK